MTHQGGCSREPHTTGPCNTAIVPVAAVGSSCSGQHNDAATTPQLTERLALHVPDHQHVEDLFDMYSDPRVWGSDPMTRHVHVDQTALMVERWRGFWERYGTGMWVATSSQPGDMGQLVGIGGCSVRHDVAWNLGFRLRPHYWGLGLAQEIIRAAVTVALQRNPYLPITAYLLEGNERSRRTTELAGLRLAWRGPDAGNPDPTAIRLLYADRSLPPSVITQLVVD